MLSLSMMFGWVLRNVGSVGIMICLVIVGGRFIFSWLCGMLWVCEIDVFMLLILCSIVMECL